MHGKRAFFYAHFFSRDSICMGIYDACAYWSQRWYKKLLYYYFPKFLRPITPQLKPINVYYKKLTPEERKRFEWRVFYFIESTQIEFRHFKPTATYKL